MLIRIHILIFLIKIQSCYDASIYLCSIKIQLFLTYFKITSKLSIQSIILSYCIIENNTILPEKQDDKEEDVNGQFYFDTSQTYEEEKQKIL